MVIAFLTQAVYLMKKIVEWEKAVQSGTTAAEITDKQIKEYFGA